MRTFDWASTPVGPVDQWPQSLKTSVSICLNSRFAILIWWGRDLVKFYNDAYAAILSNKHPNALGARGRDVWPEIWHIIGPMLEGVLDRGEATWSDDLLLELERNGYQEECYFTFSYSPIRDESGGVGGVFTPVQETTERVIGERRLRTLRDLADAARAANAQRTEEVCRVAVETLARNPFDLPFAAVYLDDGGEAVLAGTAGMEPVAAITPARVPLQPPSGPGWFIGEAMNTLEPVVVPIPAGMMEVPRGAWPVPPTSVMVLPLTTSGQRTGFLLAGISPRKRLDDAYRDFLTLVAGHVSTAVTEARAFEAERKRAEALAELDWAKTQFFSNVSHEFRTPLTLMLGPLEDALRLNGQLAPTAREGIETAHRNGLRLLRLVNSLLDFSRIEAGRARARFVPTDLAAFTADLAGTFRSAVERAGLNLIVDCEPGEPVWVDREMWEKIVLNLLSNAFKFTFDGHIAVRLRPVDGHAVLRVEDTGTGIPAQELPRVFDRFHRVDGARGRTFEGTGIGLALLQELVRLHGGSVGVESTVGHGSTFSVSIPLGKAHLPEAELGTETDGGPGPGRADLFVAEAMRWIPDDLTAESEAAEPTAASPWPERILVVDDNADMRSYIRHLLAPRYEVELAGDGEEALECVRRARPDLVLSDIMMPRVDGFELLKALRSNPDTHTVPVILLSARAGEEARSEGMDAGADDYLAKPFSARELMARVGAHLKLARARREAEEQASAILESLTDGFAALDENWRVLYVNSSGERILGRPRESLLARDWWREFPEMAASGAELWRAMRERVAAETEVLREGRWLALRADPTRDRGLSLYFRDISDDKRIRDELRRRDAELAVERDRLAAVFEQSPAFIAVLRGPDYVFERVNPAYLQVVGYRDLIGKPLLEGLPEVRGQGFIELLDQVVATGEPYVGTGVAVLIQREAGGRPEHRYIDFVYAPLTEADGTRSGVVAIGYDTTERVAAENQLRRSRAELASVFDAAPVGIAMVDRDLRHVQVNEALANMDGVPVEAHLGRTCGEVLGAADADLIGPVYREVIATGKPVRDREISPAAANDGVRKTHLLQCVPVRSSTGSVLGACAVVVDITDRKKMEEALRRSESEFRQIADSLPQLVWVARADGRVEWRNRRWYEYTGDDPSRTASAAGLLHPDDTGEALERWAKSLATGEPYKVEYRLRRKDGCWRWMLVRAEPLRNERGSIERWFGTCTDIEDQKKAEEQSKGQQQWLEAVLNLLPMAVVFVEPGTARLTFSNYAANELAGGDMTKRLSAAATALPRVYDAGERMLEPDELPRRRLARGEEIRGLELDLETPDGRRSLLIEGRILPPMHGRDAIGLAVYQDISRLKQIERTLRRSNEDLQQFAYVASHDLQEPLRTVTSFSQMLERSATAQLDPESRAYLGYVIAAARRMSALIQDLLTYSRITNEQDRSLGLVDLNEVVARVLDGLQASIADSGAVIAVNHLPVLSGDRAQWQQVFQNLLSNSLKYRRAGVPLEVEVGCEASGSDWRLWVRDNGQGFARQYADQMFGIFKRLHGRDIPGTGIGLAIVKTVVERHGGRVWAEGVEGEGATFFVLLPREMTTFEPRNI